MSDQILPSKLVTERILVRFEFKDELAWAETISNAQVTITVASGSDPAPGDMLYKGILYNATEARQQIHAGTPGVIYKVECVAVGTTGKVYTKFCYLAVLPDTAAFPPIIGTYLTSRPYPIDVTEVFNHGFFLIDGRLRPQPFPLDEIDHGFALGNVSIGVYLKSYSTQPEQFKHAFFTLESYFSGTVKTYAGPAEQYKHGFGAVGGTLEIKLIQYALKEEFKHGMSLLSGTLS